jgi:hypothetical protein
MPSRAGGRGRLTGRTGRVTAQRDRQVRRRTRWRPGLRPCRGLPSEDHDDDGLGHQARSRQQHPGHVAPLPARRAVGHAVPATRSPWTSGSSSPDPSMASSPAVGESAGRVAVQAPGGASSHPRNGGRRAGHASRVARGDSPRAGGPVPPADTIRHRMACSRTGDPGPARDPPSGVIRPPWSGPYPPAHGRGRPRRGPSHRSGRRPGQLARRPHP